MAKSKNKKVGICRECGGDVVKSPAQGYAKVCTSCGQEH